LITLGVEDLARSLKFYRDGLGFPTTWKPERGVIFFQTSGTTLALYPFDKLAEDAGPAYAHAKRPLFGGITLAHNVRTKTEVDSLLQQAERAGARIVKPAQDTFWGGYSGYFADPDGYLWEIAYGAFPIRADGSLEIP
jgi:catechol 2,3-dioxygenase-like lactoylglutathione lyase family enzyme